MGMVLHFLYQLASASHNIETPIIFNNVKKYPKYAYFKGEIRYFYEFNRDCNFFTEFLYYDSHRRSELEEVIDPMSLLGKVSRNKFHYSFGDELGFKVPNRVNLGKSW